MSGPAPEHEQPVGPTLEVTLRLLGRFMPGETASMGPFSSAGKIEKKGM